jgi:hypothetical protein
MSNGNGHRPPPSDPHQKCDDGGDYEVAFYPGFASRIEVGGKEIYKQADGQPFVLPAGSEKPFSSHALTITNKAHSVTVTLHIDDPHDYVHRIHIELLDPESKRAQKAEGTRVVAHQGGGTTVKVDNTPILCPPDCSGPQ